MADMQGGFDTMFQTMVVCPTMTELRSISENSNLIKNSVFYCLFILIRNATLLDHIF